MKKSIILILIGKRRESAAKVQGVLTKYGCNIKTRLGIHDGVLEQCSDFGFIMVEIVGEEEIKVNIIKEFMSISHVSAKLVELSL